MKIIADLHIHSKYSRAVSKDMTLENISLWSAKKGINVVGTSDFTHPLWFNEIKSKTQQTEDGLLVLKSEIRNSKFETNPKSKTQNPKTRFMLSTEIACIYKKGGRARRVHHIVFAPTIEAVEKINKKLNIIGNLKSDGRPMLGLDSRKLLEIILDADPRCVLIPAHAWTPWYSIFGSMSGFDSIEECFEDYSKHIFAIETGLSSDPSMNWRLSFLDNISLISNSDAHSPAKLGREANIFETDLSYDGIISAIKEKNPEPACRQAGNFLYTIEFFPEEGKYHFDGHRACEIYLSPEDTKKYNGLCPKCHRKLTIGVLNRIDALSDSPAIALAKAGRVPYKSVIPLQEVIAEAKGTGVLSKAVQQEYERLVEKFGTEFFVLLEEGIEEIAEASNARIAEGIKRTREGKVNIRPGYDGEFGKISLFSEEKEESQQSLF